MLIHISEQAKNDLLFYSIYKRKFSKLNSENFLNSFNSAINLLKTFPYMYPKINSNSKYRKILFDKNFLIIYIINDNMIFIDSIVNCKQNYLSKYL